MNAAIIAHFDAQNVFDDNFMSMVGSIAAVFDRIVVVTTSNITSNPWNGSSQIRLILRPNVGYDFFSYRVGITELTRDGELYENILMTNSSVLLLNQTKYKTMLSRCLSAHTSQTLVGLTVSNQITPHVQSFFVMITKDVLVSEWFKAFIAQIWPLDHKIDLIIKYEIGFSQAAIAAGLKLKALVEPEAKTVAKAETDWLKWQKDNKHLAPAPIADNGGSGFNPVHFMAAEVAKVSGLIKMELVRDNPHGVDLSFIEKIASPELKHTVKAAAATSKLSYTRNGNLSSIVTNRTALPWARKMTVYNYRMSRPRIAVVLHLYHADLLDELQEICRRIVEPFDIFITTPFESLIQPCIQQFDFPRRVTISYSENRGRDIGPFVAIFRSGELDEYTAVLKIHSKKSSYSSNGPIWRSQILNGVAGSSWIVLQSINLIQSGAGIVGPHFQYLRDSSFWGANQERVNAILSHLGFRLPIEGAQLGFFAGSMFWFSPKALHPLKDLSDEHLVFEEEAGLQDGTMAHALERMFCEISRTCGYPATSIHVSGKEIHAIEQANYQVPVL